ncbi:MAG: hypothetical protein CR955_01065 [Thiotrichales bacterium]|nr:MAG: hypothetical protein CR955_01065 [Thiotrichales bacterium]
MTFANFILVIFLLLSLLFFVVLVLLVRQIKKDGRLPPEKMPTLLGVLFIPSIIIFALIFKGISNWRADIQQENNQIKINAFVSSVYEPLTKSRYTLLKTLSSMKQLLRTIDNMEIEYPNHADVISHVKTQWVIAYKDLHQAYLDSDREIRRAWIAHNTMDSQDVLVKFSEQAVQIESELKNAEKKYQTHIYSVQDVMVKSLDQARKLLDANRKPPKSKKQRASNEALRETIKPFNNFAIDNLLAFLNKLDKRLKNEVETLQALTRLSAQQAAILRDHLYKNRDLEKPLTKIMSDWKALEEASNENLKQILFALEAEYIAVKLGLSTENPAIKAMHKSLYNNIPVIVGKGLKQRIVIDQSYRINRTVD